MSDMLESVGSRKSRTIRRCAAGQVRLQPRRVPRERAVAAAKHQPRGPNRVVGMTGHSGQMAAQKVYTDAKLGYCGKVQPRNGKGNWGTKG